MTGFPTDTESTSVPEVALKALTIDDEFGRMLPALLNAGTSAEKQKG